MRDVPAAWEELRLALCQEGQGVLYVAGGVDRGKTTLCQYLVEELCGQFLTAYLDCDVGQSTVGPPGTVGCSLHGGLTETWLRFVGSASPAGHLLPLLTGPRRLLERANERGAAFVVIDSSGYIDDPVAQEFQIRLIDLLRPDRVIALQKSQELEGILAPFTGHPAMRVHRLSPALKVRNRSPSERYRYRERLLSEYFSLAVDHTVSLSNLGIYGKVPGGHLKEDWEDRLVAFCDAEQFVLALGVVQDIDPACSVIHVRAPAFEERRMSALQVGSMKVNLAGEGRG